MSLSEIFQAAARNLVAHRLRSVLTALGVVVGTASVIAVISLMQGFAGSINSQFTDLGGNVLTLRAKNGFENIASGNLNYLRDADIDLLEHRVDGVQEVATVMQVAYGSTVRYHGKAATPQVYGVNASYSDVERQYPSLGRFIAPDDDAARRHIAVVGPKVIDDLKLPKDPSGDYIQIGTEWFKVVGVMEPRGEIFGFSQDNYIFIPFSTAQSVQGKNTRPSFDIRFSMTNINELESVKNAATRAVRASHKLQDGDEADFEVASADQLAKQFTQVMNMATFVLGGIVGISLLVGGIGIMTVMLVSVTERTREVGVMLALGAKRTTILKQFLVEAGMLSGGGGVIGIAIGLGLAQLLGLFMPGNIEPTTPPIVCAATTAFCMLVGICFGIIPASKAASLNPIDALKYE